MKMIDIVQYGSQAFPKDSKLRHAGSTKRELTGIIFAIKKCYKNLWGRKFVLFTDHVALVYLFRQRDCPPLLLRWRDLLVTLDFETVHWPGIKHTTADTLSRPREVMSLNAIDFVMEGKIDPGTTAERKRIIAESHNEGHFGRDQVYLNLWHKGYYWKGMRQDIIEEVGSCTPCLHYVVVKAGYHPLKSIVAVRPLDHTAVDLIVEIPVSKNGYRHIMVYLDIATRFLWLVPLKDKKQTSILEALVKIHATFGNPRIQQMDNGKEFKNRIMTKLPELNHIEYRYISSYHHRGNGAVERANRDISLSLKKTCDGALDDWDRHLPYLQFYLNTRILNRIGTSPFVLMFGREPNGSMDIDSTKMVTEDDIKRIEEHWMLMNQVVYQATAERVDIAQEKKRKSFDDYSLV